MPRKCYAKNVRQKSSRDSDPRDYLYDHQLLPFTMYFNRLSGRLLLQSLYRYLLIGCFHCERKNETKFLRAWYFSNKRIIAGLEVHSEVAMCSGNGRQ